METVKIVIELSEEDYKLALSRAALLGGMLDKKLVDVVRSGRRIEENTISDDTWSIKDVANTLAKHGLIAEQEPCEDAVSRQTVKEQMIYYGFHAPDMTVTEFVEDCLPSVTPHQATCEEKEKGECPFYAG